MIDVLALQVESLKAKVADLEAEIASVNAYHLGAAAARDGRPIGDNPYAKDLVLRSWWLHGCWDNGWHEASRREPTDGLAPHFARAWHCRMSNRERRSTT